MEIRKISFDEWVKEGTELFGPIRAVWKFKCPSCGNIQSVEDFDKAGIEGGEDHVMYSCIGRFIESKGTLFNSEKPCNYTLGGLFKLSPLFVILDEKEIPVFEFAK